MSLPSDIIMIDKTTHLLFLKVTEDEKVQKISLSLKIDHNLNVVMVANGLVVPVEKVQTH